MVLHPNPFNSTTILTYNLSSNNHVTLIIYDLIGRYINQVININQHAGYYSIVWDGTDMHGSAVSAGVYLYQLRAGEFIQTKKMVLLK